MANLRHDIAKVAGLVEHSPTVFSVWLEPRRSVANFKTGQFLHLALDPFTPENGYWPESRVFSIASQPGTSLLRIVYSIRGKYTKRMSEELKAGREVWLKYPVGDFVVDTKKEDCTTVLIAGGTGIAPFVGLLGAGGGRLRSVWLYYGVRSRELIIFEKELEDAVRVGFLNLDISVENPGKMPGIKAAANAGSLDVKRIRKMHEEDESAHYYISGPPRNDQLFQDMFAGSGSLTFEHTYRRMGVKRNGEL